MVFIQLENQLHSLIKLLNSIDDNVYCKKIYHLGGACIGGHTRHVIEILYCLINGYHHDEVDYFNRTRNLELEKNKTLAQSIIIQLINEIKLSNKKLIIRQNDFIDLKIESNLYREIIYNTEHVIHHLALIKVALTELKLDLVDKNFGMAYSTIKYTETIVKA